jgi:NADH dehydrogenase
MTTRLALLALGGASGVTAGTILVQKHKTITVPKQKVVVIGAGYAGRQLVKGIDKTKYDVTLVDKNLHKERKQFVFGTVGFDALIYHPQPNYVDSISENAVVDQFMLLPEGVSTLKDEVVKVENEQKKVVLKSEGSIDYDHLVFATGSIPDTQHIHMKYNCANSMWYFFKDRSDLEALLTVFRIIGLEDVVIMGGGITGVELASELSSRLTATGGNTNPRVTTCEAAPLATKGVTIIEPSSRVLPKMDPATSALITKHLQDQRVNILTDAVIKATDDEHLLVEVRGEPVKIKAVVAVWTCGVKPDDLAVRSVGHNNVTGTLALPQPSAAVLAPGQSIFAIGDCNHLLPKSAQNAKQQGAYLANYFNSGMKDTVPPFTFASQGTMIRLADRIYMDSPVYTGFLPLWVHRVIIALDI